MFLTEEQAKQGKCLLQVQIQTMQNMAGRPFPMTRPGQPPINNGADNIGNCLASACVTYWKWSQEDRSKGYCSKAGKPDF